MITFVHVLVIVSALISLAGAWVYIKNTISGKTKPNRVTWLMWAVAPLVGTAAAPSLHSDIWATSRIFLAGFIPLLVVLASFVNPKSFWKLTKFDIICGVCSVLALIAWLFVDQARIAILLAALGDGFAALPTVVKCWKYPETETGLTWVASFVAVSLVIPSITVWNIENSAFQIYLLAVNIILLFAVYRKRLGFGNSLENI